MLPYTSMSVLMMEEDEGKKEERGKGREMRENEGRGREGEGRKMGRVRGRGREGKGGDERE